jgi:ankyrin repeat protein
MKNPYIIPAAMISASILIGFWMMKPSPKPNISIHQAAQSGNIEAVKQHLAAGADVNAKDGQVFSGFFHNVDKNELSIRDLTTDKSSPSRQEIYSNTPRAAP